MAVEQPWGVCSHQKKKRKKGEKREKEENEEKEKKKKKEINDFHATHATLRTKSPACFSNISGVTPPDPLLVNWAPSLPKSWFRP